MVINSSIEGGFRIKGGQKTNYSNQPLVSIITVCLNAENHITNCINSVISQPCKNIEHIIIDGLSNDKTTQILSNYNLNLAYWRSEKDYGIYNAMNKAIALANGKWILFLGADDELLSGFSEMALLLKEDDCIYYADVLFNGNKMGGNFNTYKLAKTNICHQSIFYPKSVFDKYQYEEKYTISADHYLNIQCWIDSKFRWVYYPEIVANYSSGGISSSTKDFPFEKDRLKIIRKNLGLISYVRYLFRGLKEIFLK